MHVDTIIKNAGQLVTCASDSPNRGEAMRDVGIIENGVIAISDGIIQTVGTSDAILATYTADTTIDAGGKVVCPSFVDPHTHVCYAGDRVDEFELRIQGKTYMEIMAQGGGILNSMRAIRSTSLDDLITQTARRLKQMSVLGTTTVEIKTGYGLDTENELKMLHAIDALNADSNQPLRLIPTFMGAHAIPPEYKDSPDEFADLVINDMLPKVADWYTQSSFSAQDIPLFIDVFCEQNAFTVAQSKRILEAGQAHGMLIKAHVDEFTPLGGVTMGVELGATSLDHLDVTTAEEMQILANSDTIGVVIPAVNFNLGSTHFADARAMLDAGVALALTTDINPGSAPCPSMQFVMAIACRYQKLLPAEAFNASTINAAYAIGMGDTIGSLQVGKFADFLILDTHDYRHLAYEFGGNLVSAVYIGGKQIL